MSESTKSTTEMPVFFPEKHYIIKTTSKVRPYRLCFAKSFLVCLHGSLLVMLMYFLFNLV